MKRTWSVILYYKNGADDCLEGITLKLASKIASSHGRNNSRSVGFIYGDGKRPRRVLSEKIYYLYDDDFSVARVIAKIILDDTKNNQLPLSKIWTKEIKIIGQSQPDSD